MKTISSIDQLADVMFEVHKASNLENVDFCASMVSCAVSVATRDGLTDKEVFDLILKAATASLVTIRARQKLRDMGLQDISLEVH